jgi:hypothetical protein
MRARTIEHPGKLIASGELRGVFTLGCPPRGLLSKIEVRQASGTPVAFSVDVYNSRHAVPGAVSSSLAAGDDEIISPELSKVVPQFSGTAGGIASFTSTPGVVYHCQDDTVPNPVYKIWIVVTFASPSVDITTWDVRFDIQPSRGE